MTKAAWAQGVRNALLCLIPVIAGTWLVYFLVSTLMDASTFVAVSAAFVITFAVSLLWMMISWWRGITTRGVLLLDCGTHPGRPVFFLNAVLFGCMGLIEAASGGLWPFGPFALMYVAFWLFMASGRLAVYESGLWAYHGLVPWEKISQYSWKANTLMFRTSGSLSIFRGALPIPTESVENVKHLLEEHMSSDPS